MKLSMGAGSATIALLGLASALPAAATPTPFFFSTGNPDGKIATATRPGTANFEIESADDFVLTSPTTLISATFTGLIPTGSSASQVVVEIYRVFPLDSDVGRTPQVPTRVNSPSDVAFASRDSSVAGELTFATAVLSSSVTANNSVQPGGIHPAPNQTTLGDGPVTGEEVEFNVTFSDPLSLAAGHYFFVPQVDLGPNDDFLWLSAPRPIVPPGTAFPPGFTDLQSWTRDQFLDPDWLRVGTDIVGGATPPTFNAAFSLTGSVPLPEPATLAVMGTGLLGLVFLRRRKTGM